MKLFLSQINPSMRSGHVRTDLRDVYAMHRRIMSLFPKCPESVRDARCHFGVLFRAEITCDPFSLVERFSLIVQSYVEPSFGRLPLGYAADLPRQKAFDLELQRGGTYRFRLRANPARRLSRTSKDKQGNSVPPTMVGKRVSYREPEAQVNWLIRKSQGAFNLVGLQPTLTSGDGSPLTVYNMAETGPDRVRGRKPGHAIAIDGITFDGLLQVQDPEILADRIAAGIGPGKAFGFGLLSLAPP